MIPSRLCKLSSEWAIQPEAVTLLVNQKGVDLHTLIAGLYADTDQRMRAVQKQIEDSEENIKLCSVIGNMVIPGENQYSQDFLLSWVQSRKKAGNSANGVFRYFVRHSSILRTY